MRAARKRSSAGARAVRRCARAGRRAVGGRAENADVAAVAGVVDVEVAEAKAGDAGVSAWLAVMIGDGAGEGAGVGGERMGRYSVCVARPGPGVPGSSKSGSVGVLVGGRWTRGAGRMMEGGDEGGMRSWRSGGSIG